MIYILDLTHVGRRDLALVGGKAAHLGELARLRDIMVPNGIVVTTDAFRRASDADAMPDDVAADIARAVARLGPGPFAVRSSATTEDLPTASFAGQHASYLDVAADAVVEHVRRCWASLHTEHAASYREQRDVASRDVQMAVIVQRMVRANASGVLFTADPISGHRRIAVVEAVRGLGDAFVSGTMTPDRYRVQRDAIVSRAIVRPEPTLDDERVRELVALGRRIEAHFGAPQDIEWCLTRDRFQFVQSRPITTLFPIPNAGDDAPHVYVSVGHQQMMTDPLKPLGISVWQLSAAVPMPDAAGRIFVDVTRHLSTTAGRAALLDGLGRSDPLIGDALRTLVERGDVLPDVPDDAPAPPAGVPPASAEPLPTDPSIVSELIAMIDASVATVARDIEGMRGVELLDYILADFPERRRVMFDPRSYQAIVASIDSARWLNDHLLEWLGERNAADTLAQSAPGNVTSEMGLALLDVADTIRPHPDVVALLERAAAHGDDAFLDALPSVAGGREARDAIQRWLDRYGMRGVGEIDITRPRWSERPSTLVPLILGNVRHFSHGEAARRFAHGLATAREKERDVLARLRALPDGDAKAEETARMIERLRTFAGYREYPKYGMIARFMLYKRALLGEAERLVEAGVLRDVEDVFYLTFQELHDAVRTQRVDHSRIREREAAYRSYWALVPPRVLTSDGEMLSGAYRRDDVPAGALVGLGVSAGIVEGRARVILDVGDGELAPGDILVTRFTDPSWTPLFVTAAALVTEVGGLMTHGAVIAREYGLPAVVGVEHATTLIPDGRRIRVHGVEGYVELLP